MVQLTKPQTPPRVKLVSKDAQFEKHKEDRCERERFLTDRPAPACTTARPPEHDSFTYSFLRLEERVYLGRTMSRRGHREAERTTMEALQNRDAMTTQERALTETK